MAIVKTIVNNTMLKTTVKLVGNGIETISLASLVATNSGEGVQVVSGTPKVSIIGISLTSHDSGNGTKITRNGIDVMEMHGNYEMPEDAIYSCKLTENSDSDIVVNIGSSGTIILVLRKEEGYTFGQDLATIGR